MLTQYIHNLTSLKHFESYKLLCTDEYRAENFDTRIRMIVTTPKKKKKETKHPLENAVGDEGQK